MQYAPTRDTIHEISLSYLQLATYNPLLFSYSYFPHDIRNTIYAILIILSLILPIFPELLPHMGSEETLTSDSDNQK